MADRIKEFTIRPDSDRDVSAIFVLYESGRIFYKQFYAFKDAPEWHEIDLPHQQADLEDSFK